MNDRDSRLCLSPCSSDTWPRSRRRLLLGVFAAGLLAALCARASLADEPRRILWRIGTSDNSPRDLALAPGRHREFRDDSLFVVGRSDARRDWSFVQPGPQDDWAGAREHAFVILFGLKSASNAGECHLTLDLFDTHRQGPPELQVVVNGRPFQRSLPSGAGDASIQGQDTTGREHRCELAFPADLLREGANEIVVKTVRGSWLLYDSVELDTPGDLALAAVPTTWLASARPFLALVERDGQLWQPVHLTAYHFGEPVPAQVRLGERPPVEITLQPGASIHELLVPAVDRDTPVEIAVAIAGQSIGAQTVSLAPVRKRTVYILPHSHTDIGYTEIQTAVEQRQVNNLVQGIEYARKTADYPEGARFVWNVEVLWAADLYLNRLDAPQREDFLRAVRSGQVALEGMYLNELTGLCRPEELVRLFRYATQLSQRCGVTIDSAMISDVPGYTWGTVTAMTHAGIKYFSVAPNYFDRIGDILVQWENKPFYWVGPSGQERVLVWIPYKGYAMSHLVRELTPQFAEDYQKQLDQTGYPFDIAYMRWSGHGDNAVPDPKICEFVKEWSGKYAWPRFVITSTSKAFGAFEAAYGDRLPEVRGDWTPYWEDGAGSSARETSMNRASSDRLIQAEAAWAMINPRSYPAADFDEAWKRVLLYSEHTWGAWCSVTEPERRETLEQWAIKRSYAEQADAQSVALLARSLALPDDAAATIDGDSAGGTIEVFNTTSWNRTELVRVPQALSATGDYVIDDQAQPVPSQRLSDGELAFVARDVAPLSSRRYSIRPGTPHVAGQKAQATDNTLSNSQIRLRVDEQTGGIAELMINDVPVNLVDTQSGHRLNEYLYLIGDDPAKLQRSGSTRVSVLEPGPLVAALRIEAQAPGCESLVQDVTLAAGFDQVELVNRVDKQRLVARSYMEPTGKECVNFAFPFHFPDGQVRLEIPLAVIRPEHDQMPIACKNWFTVGRWADVSNEQFGVTWVTVDAPLVQVGGITATLLNSQTNPAVWRKSVEPTQKLYCWAMNNHWGTNYRAYQEGQILFRFVLRPHRGFDPVEASRLAIGQSQPLRPIAARNRPPAIAPLRVAAKNVLVTGLKPSDDGRAMIIRLWEAAGQPSETAIEWTSPAPSKVWLSDTSELPRQPLEGPVQLPPWGLVTVRAEYGP